MLGTSRFLVTLANCSRELVKHRSPCVTVRDGGTDNRSVDDPDLSVLETFRRCNSCTK